MKASAAIGPANPLHHLARLTFVAFLLTFIASRTLVILIMARKMPDLFLHLGGTHVHHLNYGIFLLSAVAGVLLFEPLNQAERSFCALTCGFAPFTRTMRMQDCVKRFHEAIQISNRQPLALPRRPDYSGPSGILSAWQIRI
jgi:polyferredoxin